MTVKMAGVWELAWNTPIKEVELWEYPLRDFGVETLIMEPVSGIRNTFISETNNLGITLDELRAQGNTIVFVDENGTENLETFVHPENVVYVFGKASISPMLAYMKEGDRSVVIQTPNQIAGLWPHQCAVLIMADRVRKG